MPEFDPKELANAVDGVNRAFEEFKSANDERLKEIESKGSADPLLEEKLGKINEAIDASQKRLDEFELAQKRQSRVIVDENGVNMDEVALKWAQGLAKKRGTTVHDFGAKEMDEYKRAFDAFIRRGDRVIDDNEIKALSIGSDPDGGYTVHPDMNGRIVKRVFDTSPMRAYASIQVISTDALEGIHDTDEASAGWVSETGSRASTNTPQITKWRIPVHEVYANAPATQQLLDDSEVNIEAWLSDKVADKFARMEATAFVSGNGVGRPRGFTTYSDWTTAGTFEVGAIEQFDTGVNGDFAADPNGGDALLDALYGLKQFYRNNATWFANRSTFKEVRKLKDSNGAYIWTPGIAAGQPASLLGYPVAVFEDMPDMATGSLSMAVGDMRSAYQIVDRMGIRTLRDPYTNKPYVQFYSTKRVGGDVVDFDALKIVNFQA